MSEKLLTDYFLNENLVVKITKQEWDRPFYDATCSYDGYTLEEFDIICKKCNTTISTNGRKFDGYSKIWNGPRIDKDTVCPYCGAALFDEKAVVDNDDIENHQSETLCGNRTVSNDGV